MPRLLALDWDRHEVRYVLATTRGKTVKVRAAGSVQLVDVVQGGGEPEPEVGGAIVAALSEQGVRRVKTLVGVQRSQIDLLPCKLPPAEDAELPEMVVNQAMRESPMASETAAIDFLPLTTDPRSPRRVVAAVLPAEQREWIQKQCAAAGLKPSRMLLRPLATASLWLKTQTATEPVCLLINRLPEEADLIVVAEGRVIQWRTVRLGEPLNESQVIEQLLVEVRRTMATVPLELTGDEPIGSVHVLAAPDEDRGLVLALKQEVGLPVHVVDPAAPFDLAEDRFPRARSRFAGLLGMLLDEVAGQHAIDFLHPRRPPRRLSRGQMIAAAAGAVAVVALVVTFHIWSTLAAIERENDGLRQRLAQLNDTMKKAEAQKRQIGAVAEWKAGDIVWLDELRDLSLRFPSRRDAIVLRMSMRSGRAGSGAVDLQGLVRDPQVVVDLERRIRDDFREIRSRRIQERRAEKDYTWLFESSISVRRRNKDRYTSHLSEPPEPAGTPAASAEEKP